VRALGRMILFLSVALICITPNGLCYKSHARSWQIDINGGRKQASKGVSFICFIDRCETISFVYLFTNIEEITHYIYQNNWQERDFFNCRLAWLLFSRTSKHFFI
jgi:hypothetical protein